MLRWFTFDGHSSRNFMLHVTGNEAFNHYRQVKGHVSQASNVSFVGQAQLTGFPLVFRQGWGQALRLGEGGIFRDQATSLRLGGRLRGLRMLLWALGRLRDSLGKSRFTSSNIPMILSQGRIHLAAILNTHSHIGCKSVQVYSGTFFRAGH